MGRKKNRSIKRLRQKTTALKAAQVSGRKVTNPMTRSQRKTAGKGKKGSVT